MPRNEACFLGAKNDKASAGGPGAKPRIDGKSCCLCNTDLGGVRFRSDVEGRAYCEPCFNDLRTQEQSVTEADESDPRFRCGVCGTEHFAHDLRDLAGQLVCSGCVSQKTTTNGNGHGHAGTNGHAEIDPAEEAKQIVGHLHGSLPGNILAKVICPHCWHGFAPQDVLWVAQHAELLGDPVLGPEAFARFLPSRFNAEGEALDARDMPCQVLACPRCHLTIPRSVIETSPLFVSMVGAPASGKSHLLASMCWELRRVFRDRFGITFNDADALSNLSLHRYEETLFVSGDGNDLVAIRKTELQGELYDQIRLGQQIVTLPRPFLFTLRPQARGPVTGAAAADPGRIKVMCLYDNAGEHFQPGMDSASAPGTQHMAKSKVLMFLFDPTQHQKFREHCRSISHDPQLYGASRTVRQETILSEAAARVRRYTGLSPQRKHERPLIVVVSKADIWASMLEADLDTEPLVADPAHPGTSLAKVDVPRIEKTSNALRKLLVKWTPEVVAAAEDFCRTIVYIPSSALGRGPEVQRETGLLGIRPRDIHPKWATVPILYMLAKWGGMLPSVQPPAKPGAAAQPAASAAR